MLQAENSECSTECATKRLERLQRIQELFPREEERNESLQRLYLSAGVTPELCGVRAPGGGAWAVPAAGPVAAIAAPLVDPGSGDAQCDPRGGDHPQSCITRPRRQWLLTTAVNEIGGHWKYRDAWRRCARRFESRRQCRSFCGKGVEGLVILQPSSK